MVTDYFSGLIYMRADKTFYLTNSIMDNQKTIFFVIATEARINFILRTDIFKVLKDRGYRIVIISSLPVVNKTIFQEFYGPNVFFESLCRFDRVFFALENLRGKALLISHPRLAFFKYIYDLLTRRYRERSSFSGRLKKIFSDAIVCVIPRKLRVSEKFWDNLERLLARNRCCSRLFKKYNPSAVVLASAGAETRDKLFISYCQRFSVPSFAVDNNIDVFEFRYFSKPRPVSVWALFSDILKNEAMEIQQVPEDRIVVTGPARYDHYFKNFQPQPREEFFKEIGADPAKKLITYGTQSPKMYPYDNDIIRIILGALNKNYFQRPAQLFVRFGRGNNPMSHQNVLKSIIWERVEGQPHRDHVANLLYHSDVVISVGSTFCSEACMVDTPAIWIGFDGFAKYEREESYSISYELNLCKRILATGSIRLAKTPEALNEHIKEYLDNPALDKEKRRLMIEQEYNNPDGNAGKRIAELIINQINNREKN